MLRIIQQACSPVRAAQAVQRHLPRGTPSVASVQSPAAFPARVIDKHQKTYAGILHTADWIALFADLNAQGRAWLFSLSLRSVGPAYLRALPMAPPFALAPSHYSVALRHQLFAPQPLVPAGRPCGSCGQPLDPTGTHYLACMGGQQNQNWYLYLHTVLLTVVLAMIRSVFPHANIRSEDADGTAFYSPNHRPDTVVLDFEGVAGICLLTFRWRGPWLLATWLGPPSRQVTRRTGRSGPSSWPTATSGTIVWCPLSWRSLGPWCP
eukprot:jgi/Mesvir1/14801/Mv05439-RA.1